jgi:glucose-6-phosphate-specific signal transduction histidine kinase
MLQADHRALIDMLHDELGQNLVAIRSFAAAIAEQHAEADNDTAEIAAMINDAADSAYRRCYHLMQELRAQHAADQEMSPGLDECLREARLQENNIGSQFRIDPAVGELDPTTRAFVLRNVRCFANYARTLGVCKQVSVELRPALGNSDRLLDLFLGYSGKFDKLDCEDLSLRSITERTDAIGGEILVGCNAAQGEFTLQLYFDPLVTNCTPSA